MAKTALVSQAFPLTLRQYYGMGKKHYFETTCTVEFGSTPKWSLLTKYKDI